ncbi:hypothetical protein [Actinokineospora sp. NBRC 105648]|uniref:hypothetical protein n=1 Tax=Actinokineospora sp. NBRC 105648 TaxID=3032206 RepID=UPI002552E309|nr:hypothetical protein [Actinokineospora sp. NBRC 105648]
MREDSAMALARIVATCSAVPVNGCDGPRKDRTRASSTTSSGSAARIQPPFSAQPTCTATVTSGSAPSATETNAWPMTSLRCPGSPSTRSTGATRKAAAGSRWWTCSSEPSLSPVPASYRTVAWTPWPGLPEPPNSS